MWAPLPLRSNLVQGSDPALYLDFLLHWARAAWPASHLLLLNILPNTLAPVEALNVRYQALAARWGASYSTCGCRIDPTDTTLLKDGHHPAGGCAAGLGCGWRVARAATLAVLEAGTRPAM